MFSGSMVALVTPFKDGKVDYVALQELVDWHIKSGTDALVPCGTTGESPTLSHEEHRSVIRSVIEAAAGKVPVIAGTGSNNTREAVGLTKFAEEAGADGALVVEPYYNKPTQEGLYRHYREVAENTKLPIVLYNIPGRCGVAMTVETLQRLYEIENIVAVKDATGSVSLAMDLLAVSELTVLSGDDALTMPFMAVGGKGVISVIANLVPAENKALVTAMLQGNIEEALKVQRKLHPLCRALFAETNPIGIKTAMELAGRISSDMRLPLTPMSERARENLRSVMSEMELID